MTDQKQKIGVGIDFGTSNSAAAWYDGETVRFASLEADQVTMPTATHLDRDLISTVGMQAVTQYIEDNRDRIVELVPEVIAKSAVLVGDGDPSSGAESEVATNDTYGKATIDPGMPGRLFRGVKRLLGSPGIKRLMVFDQPFRLVALITPVLLHINKGLKKATNQSSFATHIGHPVEFEGHDQHRNDLGLSRLTEACEYAGFKNLSFYPEPIAATLSYLHERGDVGRGTVLTVDFGGGTLDLSVVRFNGLEFDVLATGGVAVGGDHIDQLIFKRCLFPLLGKGELWKRVVDGYLIENEFPFDEFEDKLLNWAVTYTLNQGQYRAKVADMIKQGGTAAEKFSRLDDLITHNHSYLAFQAIKDAKVVLSHQEETFIDIPELDISLPFNRDMFETLMQPVLEQLEAVTDSVLARAGFTEADIDMVVRTGGSSQISAVRRLLENRFPEKVIEHDPFTSVTAGLAIASYHGYEFKGAASK